MNFPIFAIDFQPLRFCWLALLTWLALPAWAQGAKVTSDLTVAQVVRADDGTERLQPARFVKPGDLLQYTAVYTNQGNDAVRGLVASLPIPAGTELVDAASLPRDTTASVDGKAFAPLPLMRKVRRADGSSVDEAVPLADYRALRWPGQRLAAAATFSTGARVRVVSTPAAAPAP